MLASAPVETATLLGDAESALGRLDGVSQLLPNPNLLVRPYLVREAVASTRIEGTRATITEVFDAEAADTELTPDLQEVLNHVRATEHAVARLATSPLSMRLVREAHAILLDGVRGRDKQPGQVRTTQNWIGPPTSTIDTATYVRFLPTLWARRSTNGSASSTIARRSGPCWPEAH